MEINKKAIIITSSILLGIFILLLIFSTVFGLMNEKSDKIIKGVYINNIDVSNLSEKEATEKLTTIISEKNKENIKLKYSSENYEKILDKELVNISYDIERSVEDAYSIGRYRSVLINNFNIIKTKMKKEKINMNITYNDQEIENIINTINTEIPNGIKQTDYYIDETNLIITKGKEGLAIQQEEFKNNLINLISDLKSTSNEIEIPITKKVPDAINIEKIYQEIHKEAKNAYYTEEPFQVYPHIVGVDLAISIEEAKKILEEDKEEYTIPLKITNPEITTDKLGDVAFPDLLATFSTKYNAKDVDRTTNLQIASRKINGTVIMPGETFSYNKALGERTIAAGYKEAKVYENGRVVDGLGGGICQISSTLYNSIVFANLDIVSRRNHQFVPSYVTEGRDATVVYGLQDFKFKNNRKYPVKIVSSVKGGTATVAIYGRKEEVEYKVDIKTTIVGTIPMQTEYIDDAGIELGKEVVAQQGHNGSRSETYKVLYLNGKEISRTLLSKDTYNAMKTTIKRGTKVVQNNSNQNTSNNGNNNNDNGNSNGNDDPNQNNPPDDPKQPEVDPGDNENEGEGGGPVIDEDPIKPEIPEDPEAPGEIEE